MVIVTSELKHGTIKIHEPTRKPSFAIIVGGVTSGNNTRHDEYCAVIFYLGILAYSQTIFVKTTGRCKK